MFSGRRLLGGGKRQLHSLDFKMAVIGRLKEGESHISVATDFDIPVGTVSAWWLQRDDINEKFERQLFIAKVARLDSEIEEENDRTYGKDYVWEEEVVPRVPTL
jgi:hypothetical protein